MEKDKKLSNETETEETAATPVTEAVEENAETVEAAPAVESAAKKIDEREKKPMSKGKRIANAVVLAVQIAFVVLAIVICLVVMLNPQSGDKVSPVGLKLLPVLTGSMDGDKKDSFPEGALVFATSPKKGGNDLKVGDIVTFKMLEDNSRQVILVTHRIIEVKDVDGVKKYRTQGDANPLPDEADKLAGDILAVYAFHINGLGSALTWIRDGYHFIYVIIIPLGLLLIYNIYLVAQIVVENKMKKAKAAAAESAKQAALASIDEEAIKRKAIEEYLKSQGLSPAAGDGGASDQKGEETKA
ncbi:MAG: signal peptidase I [Clostridia bacterium]|nr:signal peptidase I [Clostridia bacterium]